MPFDGSGNYNRSFPPGGWQGDSTANIKIKADRHDQHDNDLAAALSQMICKDGQSSPSANIPWNNKKITSLAAPTVASDAATKGYVDGVRNFPSAINITGSYPESIIKFTGTTGPWGNSYATADLSSGVSGSVWVWNDKALFSGNNVMTLSEAGTLQLLGRTGATAPILSLNRMDTIGGDIGYIQWVGNNGASQQIEYATQFVDVTNATTGVESGQLIFNVKVGGVLTQRLVIHDTGVSVAGIIYSTGNISSGGTMQAAGNLIASGYVQSGTIFTSSTTFAVLSTTGAGSIQLRPNGSASGTGAFSIASNGDASIAGGLSCGRASFNGDIYTNNVIGAAGSITTNTNLHATGNVYAGGGSFNGATGAVILAPNTPGSIYLRPQGSINAASQAALHADGTFGISSAAALKPGGGAWVDGSDERIKTVRGNYENGLAAILALQPVIFTYNGNDTMQSPEVDAAFPDAEISEGQPAAVVPYESSTHYGAAVDGTEFIGLVAQQAEIAMPELVRQTSAYIDGEPVDDLRILDSAPLVYAFINAFKEISNRLTALEGAPA